jgi:3-methyladenine DNA glycosylase AlkD
MTYDDVLIALKSFATEKRAKSNAWFFKTGAGEYAEGDLFWGISVPDIRQVVKLYKDLPAKEIVPLLRYKVHEARLCALLIMVKQYAQSPKEMYELYLANMKYINNWDLVDSSASYIVGAYLQDRPKNILSKLARSTDIWERRIAMIATFSYIKQGIFQDALKIAELLVDDTHDLIQKAVGWMLREIGKHGGVKEEEAFLEKYAATMPRTALRYAIEHFSPEKKSYYMQLKIKRLQ